MDKDRVAGAAKTLKGRAKEAAGKATGDRKTQARGRADQSEGEVAGGGPSRVAVLHANEGAA